MQLYLLETWSKHHEGNLPFTLPKGWSLATHQREAYEALHDSDVDIVFDTAMTGDGKSLAGYLPLLRPQAQGLGNGVFAYPTNELIRDQERQLKEYLRRFEISFDHQCLNGPEISRAANEEETTRYETILYLTYRQRALLTNPDIFNLIESFAYANPLNPATLAQHFSNTFRYIAFDEFHVFSAPQIACVLDAMLFIQANSAKEYPTKFLFLSATPSESLRDAFDKAGLRYRIIEGQYKHGPKPSEHFRSILKPAVLELLRCDQSTGGILSWVENNLDTIRNFYQENLGSKGVIICNSLFTAKKLYTYLQKALEDDGISVGENTGLSGKEARRISLEQDLVVATSTVDVGVDFRINFLVFESLNAGTFIQRLGRLGRHEGFGRYYAAALLPSFLVDRFERHYQESQPIDRHSFFQTLKEQVFPGEQEFRAYIPRWGGVRATQRLLKLYKYGGRNKHETLIRNYQPQALSLFRISGDTKRRTHEMEPATNHELSAFRGAGLMDIWTYDPASQAVSTVNVLRLVSGTDFELVSRAEAESVARELGVPFYPTYLRGARIPYCKSRSLLYAKLAT